MDFIEAEALPDIEPSFATAEEAIEHGRRALTNKTRSGADLSSLVGTTIEAVDWCDTAVRFHLLGGQALGLTLNENRIDVVAESGPQPDLSPRTIREQAVVRLGAHQFDWHRVDILNALLGRKFARLQLGVGPMWNYLYASGGVLLHFSALINVRTQRPFLYWDLTD